MAGRLQVYFFNVLDHGEGRPRRQIVLESFDALQRPFGQSLNAPVRQIAHVPYNLMAGRGSLREETISDALHSTANQKFSRNFHNFNSPAIR